MFKTELKALRDLIISEVPVFQRGFEDVIVQEETGQIIADTPTGWLPVFPADELGNYFYLRNTGSARVAPGMQVTDCDPAHLMTLQVYLVAVADSEKGVLISYLLRALSADGNVAVTAIDWNTDSIIAAELADAPAETLEAALQRADGQSLIRIAFSLSKNYLPYQCLPPLC